MIPSFWERAALQVALALLLTLPLAASAQDTWLETHQNTSRHGRIAGTGQINDPVVVWNRNTGGAVQDQELFVGDFNLDGLLDYAVEVGGAITTRQSNGTLLWDTPPLGARRLVALEDFNGDGRQDLLVAGSDFRILDGRSGAELWKFGSEDGSPLSNNDAFVLNADDDPEPEVFVTGGRAGWMALHDFSEGFSNTRIWTNDTEGLPTNVFRPVLGDLDTANEGLEIGVVNQNNCQIIFVSLQSGETLRVTEPLTRGLYCYGLAQVADVDDDPQEELIFTGSIARSNGSVGVTVYDLSDDAVQWQIEHAANNPDVSGLAPAGIVADLDGDERSEMAFSVFNNTEDVTGDDGVNVPGKWTTVFLDAATGSTLGYQEDRVVLGLLKLDAGERILLRASNENSAQIPISGTVEAWSLNGERAPLLSWSLDNTSLVSRRVDDIQVNSRDLGSVPGVFGQGDADILFALHDEGETFALQKLQPGLEDVEVVASVPIEPGTALSLLEPFYIEGEPLAPLKTNRGEVRVFDTDLTLRARLRFTGHVPRVLSNGSQVVYRDSANDLVAFDPSAANIVASPEPLWTRATFPTGGLFLGVDLENDGTHEYVQAGRLNDGTHYVEALSNGGDLLWRASLPEASSLPTEIIWGNFGGDDVRDLFLFQNTRTGEQGIKVLDGNSGEELFSRTSNPAEVNPYPNRQAFRLEDQDGDGYDDLLLLHYTTMETLSGNGLERLGEVRAFPPQTSRPTRSTFFSHDGEDLVFLNLFVSERALANLDHPEASWSVLAEPSQLRAETFYAGMADANGDGLWDIAIPGRFGDLVILNGLDGSLIRRTCFRNGQTFPLNDPASTETCQNVAPLSSVTVADINGDGDEDYILGTSDGWLHSITAATGAQNWSLELRGQVSHPVVIDYDGDGLLEIIAPTSGSRLVGIDQVGVEPISSVREVNFDDNGNIPFPEVDIDVLARRDQLAAAWDPSEGADGYLITLLSSNLNQLVEWVQTSETSYIFEGLDLIPGSTYYVEVIPFNDQLGPASPTRSDGVFVVNAGPLITSFQAIPNRFDPSQGQTTLITGNITSDVFLAQAELQIRALGQASPVVMRVLEIPLSVQSLPIEFLWDGTDEEGTLQPEGMYQVQLIAYDREGTPITDVILVEIATLPIEPDASDLDMDDMGEEDMGGTDAEPDTFEGDEDPDEMEKEVVYRYRDRDGCCGCQTLQVRPGRTSLLLLVLFGLVVVFQRRRR